MSKNIVEKHFDKVAESYDSGKRKYSFYYESLKKLLGSIIPTNKKVFEIGCGTGDLLYSLKPKYGYGMDISQKMVELSKSKYKKNTNLKFSTAWPNEKFDYIFMSDVIEHLENPGDVFNNAERLMRKDTVLVNTMANPLWEPLLMFWERRGWKMEEGKHKRISYEEIEANLRGAGLKVVNHDFKLLIPVEIPFITAFINKYLERYFRRLSFVEYLVAVKS